MNPSKHELIGAWLLTQPWFVGDATPALENVGGLRHDDPAEEVGMGFILVRDSSLSVPVTYHVPLTYGGSPLKGAESSLLGTSEHGVLGTRWMYDAEVDPVWHTQLQACVAGEALAQHQRIPNTVEPAVHLDGVAVGAPTPVCLPRGSIIRRPEADGMGQ